MSHSYKVLEHDGKHAETSAHALICLSSTQTAGSSFWLCGGSVDRKQSFNTSNKDLNKANPRSALVAVLLIETEVDMKREFKVDREAFTDSSF